MTSRPHQFRPAVMAGAALLTGLFDAGAFGQSYEFEFQELVGDRATFYVNGPATGSDPDVEGNAILQSVEFPSGDDFQFFYKPVGVSDITFNGPLDDWRIRAGSRCTVGLNEEHQFGAADGDPGDASAYDVEVFERLMLEAMQNNNLNNYVDCGSNAPRFAFTIEFNLLVKDNDPDPDDFGEILYFERGAGDGNSWLKMQAVDENGNALGPWLVMSPSETVQTTPQTSVYRIDQKVGTTSIDVSRLGVTELRYLRVSNDVVDEPAYTGGGDINPDFKIMAVMTNEEQLQALMGAFD